LTNKNFGLITTQGNLPRNLQIGARLVWWLVWWYRAQRPAFYRGRAHAFLNNQDLYLARKEPLLHNF